MPCVPGLIVPGPESVGFETTPKGRAHVAQLCNLSLPIPTWVSASGEPIKA